MSWPHPPEEFEYFGRAVASTRSALGIKRKELAKVVGMSYPYLAEIENGQKMPAPTMLARIAAALHVTPSRLMALADALEAEEKAGWPPGWPARVDAAGQ
jgi:transcriptional regulator with XRE-family HTH domain